LNLKNIVLDKYETELKRHRRAAFFGGDFEEVRSHNRELVELLKCAWHTLEDSEGKKAIVAFGELGAIAPIDYETVTPENLEKRLSKRLSSPKNI